MDKYLPTGNDFVSLPRINERTGGLEDITFLYMAAKGLIDIRGSESTPLIQPYVHLDGVGSLSPAHLAWTRLDDWLSQSTAQLGSLELKTLYVPPIDERGFAIQMTVHNTSESAQDVVIGLSRERGRLWRIYPRRSPGIAQPGQTVKGKPPQKRRAFRPLTAHSRLCGVKPGDGGYITAEPIPSAERIPLDKVSRSRGPVTCRARSSSPALPVRAAASLSTRPAGP